MKEDINLQDNTQQINEPIPFRKKLYSDVNYEYRVSGYDMGLNEQEFYDKLKDNNYKKKVYDILDYKYKIENKKFEDKQTFFNKIDTEFGYSKNKSGEFLKPPTENKKDVGLFDIPKTPDFKKEKEVENKNIDEFISLNENLISSANTLNQYNKLSNDYNEIAKTINEQINLLDKSDPDYNNKKAQIISDNKESVQGLQNIKSEIEKLGLTEQKIYEIRNSKELYNEKLKQISNYKLTPEQLKKLGIPFDNGSKLNKISLLSNVPTNIVNDNIPTSKSVRDKLPTNQQERFNKWKEQTQKNTDLAINNYVKNKALIDKLNETQVNNLLQQTKQSVSQGKLVPIQENGQYDLVKSSNYLDASKKVLLNATIGTVIHFNTLFTGALSKLIGNTKILENQLKIQEDFNKNLENKFGVSKGAVGAFEQMADLVSLAIPIGAYTKGAAEIGGATKFGKVLKTTKKGTEKFNKIASTIGGTTTFSIDRFANTLENNYQQLINDEALVYGGIEKIPEDRKADVIKKASNDAFISAVAGAPVDIAFFAFHTKEYNNFLKTLSLSVAKASTLGGIQGAALAGLSNIEGGYENKDVLNSFAQSAKDFALIDLGFKISSGILKTGSKVIDNAAKIYMSKVNPKIIESLLKNYNTEMVKNLVETQEVIEDVQQGTNDLVQQVTDNFNKNYLDTKQTEDKLKDIPEEKRTSNVIGIQVGIDNLDKELELNYKAIIEIEKQTQEKLKNAPEISKSFIVEDANGAIENINKKIESLSLAKKKAIERQKKYLDLNEDEVIENDLETERKSTEKNTEEAEKQAEKQEIESGLVTEPTDNVGNIITIEPKKNEQVEPPKVEPPKVEPPKIEPPKIEPPKIEPPKIEPPKIEPPKIEQTEPEKKNSENDVEVELSEEEKERLENVKSKRKKQQDNNETEPQKNRRLGYKIPYGQTRKIERKGKIKNIVYGKETNIHFTKNKKEVGKYAVISANDLVPTHIEGVKNETHFIPELQPRDRSSLDRLKIEAETKAKNLEPDLLMDDNKAYFGAPIINSRGELIQGTGRSEALLKYFNIDKTDSKNYIKKLLEKAKELGLDKNDINKIENPVLVRVLDVEDNKAIELGQYTTKDLEDIVQKGSINKSKANLISEDTAKNISNYFKNINDLNNTSNSNIRSNAENIINILIKNNIIKAEEKELYINGNGEITKDGIASINEILSNFVLSSSVEDVSKIINKPNLVYFKKLLEKNLNLLVGNENIRKVFQNSIIIANKYQDRKLESFKQFVNSKDLFTNESVSDKFNPSDILFTEKILSLETLNQKSEYIKEVYNNLTGLEGLFNIPKMSLEKSILEANKKEYIDKNGEIKYSIEDENINNFQSMVRAAQELSEYIRKKIKINPDGSIYLYHGTNKNNIENINKEGFNKNSFFSISENGLKNGDSPFDVAKRKYGKDGIVIKVKIDARYVENAAAGSEIYSPYKLVKNNSGIFTIEKNEINNEAHSKNKKYSIEDEMQNDLNDIYDIVGGKKITESKFETIKKSLGVENITFEEYNEYQEKQEKIKIYEENYKKESEQDNTTISELVNVINENSNGDLKIVVGEVKNKRIGAVAFFDPKTNTITISSKLDPKTKLSKIGHEVTHFLEAFIENVAKTRNNEIAKAILKKRDMVLKELGLFIEKNLTTKEGLERVRKELGISDKYKGIDLINEIFPKLIENELNKNDTEAKGIFKKMKDIVKDYVQKIKDFIFGLKGFSDIKSVEDLMSLTSQDFIKRFSEETLSGGKNIKDLIKVENDKKKNAENQTLKKLRDEFKDNPRILELFGDKYTHEAWKADDVVDIYNGFLKKSLLGDNIDFIKFRNIIDSLEKTPFEDAKGGFLLGFVKELADHIAKLDKPDVTLENLLKNSTKELKIISNRAGKSLYSFSLFEKLYHLTWGTNENNTELLKRLFNVNTKKQEGIAKESIRQVQNLLGVETEESSLINNEEVKKKDELIQKLRNEIKDLSLEFLKKVKSHYKNIPDEILEEIAENYSNKIKYSLEDLILDVEKKTNIKVDRKKIYNEVKEAKSKKEILDSKLERLKKENEQLKNGIIKANKSKKEIKLTEEEQKIQDEIDDLKQTNYLLKRSIQIKKQIDELRKGNLPDKVERIKDLTDEQQEIQDEINQAKQTRSLLTRRIKINEQIDELRKGNLPDKVERIKDLTDEQQEIQDEINQAKQTRSLLTRRIKINEQIDELRKGNLPDKVERIKDLTDEQQEIQDEINQAKQTRSLLTRRIKINEQIDELRKGNLPDKVERIKDLTDEQQEIQDEINQAKQTRSLLTRRIKINEQIDELRKGNLPDKVERIKDLTDEQQEIQDEINQAKQTRSLLTRRIKINDQIDELRKGNLPDKVERIKDLTDEQQEIQDEINQAKQTRSLLTRRIKINEQIDELRKGNLPDKVERIKDLTDEQQEIQDEINQAKQTRSLLTRRIKINEQIDELRKGNLPDKVERIKDLTDEQQEIQDEINQAKKTRSLLTQKIRLEEKERDIDNNIESPKKEKSELTDEQKELLNQNTIKKRTINLKEKLNKLKKENEDLVNGDYVEKETKKDSEDVELTDEQKNINEDLDEEEIRNLALKVLRKDEIDKAENAINILEKGGAKFTEKQRKKLISELFKIIINSKNGNKQTDIDLLNALNKSLGTNRQVITLEQTNRIREINEKIEVSRKYIQEDLLNNLVKKIGNENLTEKEIESLVKDTEKLVKDEIKNVFKLIEEKENIFNKNISFSDFILTLANSSILSTRTIVGNYLEVSSNAVQKNIINVIQNLFNKDKISFSYRKKLFDRVYQFNNILQFLESIKEVESLGDKYVNSIAKIAKNNLELDKRGVYKLGLKDKFINNILSLGILKNGKSLPVFGGYIDLISRGIQGGEKIAVSDAQSRFFLKTISNLGVEKYLKDNSFDIIALKFAFDFKNSYSDLVDYILKNKEDNKKAIELLGLNENNKEKVLKTLINGSIDYIKKETYRNENVITKFLVQQKNSKNYFYKTINLALNLGFKFAKVLSNVADKGLQVNSVLYALSRYYSLNYKISKERLKETNQPLYYLKKQELNSVRNYAIFGSIVRLAGAGLVMGGLAGYDEEQDKVYLNIGDKKSSPIKYEFAMWALQTGIFTQTYVNKDKVDGQTPLMTAISELRVLIPELNFSSIGDKSTLKQIETMAGSSIAADFLKQTKQAVKETYNKFNEVTGVLEKNKIDISGEQKENIFNNIATEVLFNVFLNPTINYAGGSSIKTFTTDYGADAKTQIEKLKKSFNVKNIFNLPRKEKTFKSESENELKNAEMYVFGDKSINFINKISNKLVVKDFLGKIVYFEKIKKTPNFLYNNLIYQGKYKTDNGNNIVFSKEQKNEVDRKFEENLSIMINAVEKNINFVGLNPNNDYEEYNIDDFLEDNKDIISKVRKIEKNSENITPKEFENLVSKIRNKAKTFTENWVKHKYRGKIKEEEKNK